MNSGSVRIDDVLPPGPITQYDIIRILPFGGRVLKATFDGALLAQVLDVGLKNQGTGGFLQTAGVTRDGDRWLVEGEPLNPSGRYTVAITDFLLTGGETNLGFLVRTNPQVHDVQELRDVRQAVIEELKARSNSRAGYGQGSRACGQRLRLSLKPLPSPPSAETRPRAPLT